MHGERPAPPNLHIGAKAQLSLDRPQRLGTQGSYAPLSMPFLSALVQVKAVLGNVSWCVSRYRSVSKWISESPNNMSSTCEWVVGVRYSPIEDVSVHRHVLTALHPCERMGVVGRDTWWMRI